MKRMASKIISYPKCILVQSQISIFDCLFLWDFLSHSRSFHSVGDVTITGEELQILTRAWHSWSFRFDGSLTCHTYCWQAFCSGAVTRCYNDLGLYRPGIELRSPACEVNVLPLRHRGGEIHVSIEVFLREKKY